MSPSYVPGEQVYSKRVAGCLPQYLSVFVVRRRHFRRTVYVIVVLFTLVFILKIQHLISNLTHVHDASASNLEFRWTLTKMVSERPVADRDGIRAQNPFAQFGIGLVPQPSLLAPQETSVQRIRSRDFNASHSLKFSKQDYSSEGSGYGWDGSVPGRQMRLSKSNLLVGELDFDLNNNGQLTESQSRNFSQPGKNRVTTLAATRRTHLDLYLTVLVISRPNNVLLRQAVRKTWGKNALDFGVWVRFVVGRQENWDDIVDREDHMHRDVIVVEEEDTYEYLPNKVLDGFSWVLRQTVVPKFIMKVDDDTVVNLPYLIRELHSGIINSTQILGAICVNSSVIRDPADKWSVSNLDYPFDVYPTYAFGGGYVTSVSAASLLLETRSKLFDWIHLEDVYITGILAMKAGISHVAHSAFAFWTSHKASACEFVQEKRITSVNHTEKEIFSLYTNTQALLRSRNVTQCATKYTHIDRYS